MPQDKPQYFEMDSKCSDRMLLADLDAVGSGRGQSWIEGAPFHAGPTQPVEVAIAEDYEDDTPLDFFGTPPVMTKRLYDALLSGGVDNMQAYECILVSLDGSKRLEGYKAVNIVGLVSMASAETKFLEGYPSQSIDAHIVDMKPDISKARALDLFRLAELVGVVVVSERLKKHLETYEFPYLVFRPIANLVT